MYVLCCVVQILLLLPSAVRTWDVLVASDGQLLELSAVGELHEVETSAPLGSLVSLAISPKQDVLYIADSSQPNASIHKLDIQSGEILPVLPQSSFQIAGLALDPLSNILYWTTGYGHSIMKADLNGHSDFRRRSPNIVHLFREEIPQGIALDSCGRYIFWTNTNFRSPSIERSNLDGSRRSVIVKKDLYVPLGVTVDQAERKLYWSQELEGVYYSIERSDLDGSNREVMRSMHHQPFTLAIGPDYIYWADWINNAIWRKDKRSLTQGEDPVRVHLFHSSPTGLVANVHEAKTDAECRAILSSFEIKKVEATTILTATEAELVTEPDWSDGISGDEFCLNNGAVLVTKDQGQVCRCLPGYSGVRCEIELCFNYCLHGVCSMDTRGGASCVCEPGYQGSRCELSLCSSYCLNGGHCNIVDGKPSCDCHESFKGQRCELHGSLTKLCGSFCVNGLADVPLQTASELEALCLCPSVKRGENEAVGLNGTTYFLSDSMSQISSRKDSSLANNSSSALLYTIGCLCILLFLVVVVLVVKVIKLRKRPRIKKRFIGSKTVTPTPLTNRPSPATDQCEINIENCCNMNICETPCFEPNLRTPRPGSKREEKKTLLDSMENAQGGSHDDLY